MGYSRKTVESLPVRLTLRTGIAEPPLAETSSDIACLLRPASTSDSLQVYIVGFLTDP